jgi:hypothetical protein
MTLFAATLSTGLVLLVLGAVLLWSGALVRRAAHTFPRSQTAALLLFGGAALWFLDHVYNLSPADFGDYRGLLLLLFGGVAVGAFFVTRDFLAVRGLAILLLLAASPLREAAFLQPPQSRLFLVAFVYTIMIPAGLLLGSLPYLLRDLIAWLWAKPARARALGAAFSLYGLLLAAIAYNYPA